jgi:hypothetical protein
MADWFLKTSALEEKHAAQLHAVNETGSSESGRHKWKQFFILGNEECEKKGEQSKRNS